jgi:DNA-binding transcriptional ArsR family regulator
MTLTVLKRYLSKVRAARGSSILSRKRLRSRVRRDSTAWRAAPFRRTSVASRHGRAHAPSLDASSGALSEATRRGILERLGRVHASICNLAPKLEVTRTSMRDHVHGYARAGDISKGGGSLTTEEVGRVPWVSATSAWKPGGSPYTHSAAVREPSRASTGSASWCLDASERFFRKLPPHVRA